MFRFVYCLAILIATAAPLRAQDAYWVQIEASRTLAEAQERAQLYARRFDDLQGYYLGTGFYGIVLGPYSESTARQELSRLLASGQIPSDSYLQNGRRFEQQFWPIGGGQSAPVAQQEPQQRTVNPIPGAQETLAEARASEAALSAEQRQELQRALQWAGFYNAAIDGAFGRGTRTAMEAWQVANLQQPTGVLTTSQRALLLEEYNAILTDVGMQGYRDDRAGIAMDLPLGVVSFTEYQPPFAHFDATGPVPEAQVLLISQQGDAEMMRGLFEVMQSLDIVPLDGPREFSGDSFFIEGMDEDIHSFTYARRADGATKGFTLVWPAGDEARRSRILQVMRESFTPLDAVLNPASFAASEAQSIDMVSGLAVRQPQITRSGFFVSNTGHVLTTPEAVESCDRITLDGVTEARLLATDATGRLALVAPQASLAPIAIASLQTATPRLQSAVAVAGYPFGTALDTATMTFGTLVDLRDLGGDESLLRLSAETREGDAGGPVLDETGAVMGMILPASDGNRSLPSDVQFAVKAPVLADFLAATGISTDTAAGDAPLTPVALADRAANMTVQVSCW